MDLDLEREENLLKIKHPQKELFLCDLGDVALKDDTASMEHPIFSLSKTPDLKSRTYVNGNVTLEVNPSSKGLATIWDKDVLIFAISQLMHAKNNNQPISQYVEFNAKDFLVFSNRSTGGYDYEKLRDAMMRLDGTRMNTTIKTGDEEEFETFGLIERARVKRKDRNGRVSQWGLKLSDWLFRAVESNEVLTLHPDYFRLKSSLERRLCEIARKHCGAKKEWSIGYKLLQKKCGSTAPLKSFKFRLKKIASTKTIPDYFLTVDDEQVIFTLRTDSKVGKSKRHKVINGNQSQSRPSIQELKPKTWETVTKILMKAGLDKYAIFDDFCAKIEREKRPDSLDGAFIAYAKRVADNSGNQRDFNF